MCDTPLPARADDRVTADHGGGNTMGLLLAIAWSLFRLPPWEPVYINEGLDPSWVAVINGAARNGWHFGRDILFTYGPLGYLHARMFDPATYSTMMAAWLFAATVFATACWRVLASVAPGWGRRCLVTILFVEIVSRDTMAFCFVLQWLAFFDITRMTDRRDRGTVHADRTSPSILRLTGQGLLLLVVAALPWVKFSYAVSVGGLAICLGMAAVIHRRWPWGAIALAAMSLGVWFMTGHDTDDLRGYLVYGVEVSRGYSEAMGDSPSSAVDWCLLAVTAVTALGMPVWIASQLCRGRLDGGLTALFLLGLLFVVWKSAFVRWHPDKVATFVATAVPLLILGWLSPRPESHVMSRRVGSCFTAGMAVLLMILSVISTSRTRSDAAAYLDVLSPSRRMAEVLVHSVRQPDWRGEFHNEQLARIRQDNPIPPLTGTVDVMPTNLAVAMAHRLDVRLRPVIQSYSAYTPRLMDANLTHYASAPPDNVLLRIGPIDGHLPTAEDGPLWLELLQHYEPITTTGDALALSRRAESRQWERELIHQQTISWGERLTIDDNRRRRTAGWLWCRIDCRTSMAGHMANTLYRLPNVTLNMTTDSQPRSFRLVPTCGRAGFLLAPLVLTPADLPRLWEPWEQSNVADSASNAMQAVQNRSRSAITLTLETPVRSLFEEQIDVELWAVTPINER